MHDAAAYASEDAPKGRGLRITVPKGRRRPDEFYEKVARLYGQLSATGSRRPASDIAEANDLPVSTVHRWIKEARSWGLLPGGQRGRAG